MMTKDFGMGFFGRNPFDKDRREKFQEDWSKMTDGEKLDFMNKRVEHMGRNHFSVESIDARCLEWMNMSPEEKQTIVDSRKQAFENRIHGHGIHSHFGHMHS